MKQKHSIVIAFVLFLNACNLSKDLSENMPPPRNQKDESSVVGFAVAAALEHAIYQKDKKMVVISPRYIFNNINNLKNEGATISDALDLLKDKGAVEESAWPYSSGDFAQTEPVSVKNAVHYRIRDYYQIVDFDRKDSTVQALKKALKQKKVIIAGIKVTNSLFNVSHIYSPTPEERSEGGHAINIVGYDDKSGLFKFRNSWGVNWAEKGYAYIKYEDLKRILKYAYVINY